MTSWWLWVLVSGLVKRDYENNHYYAMELNDTSESAALLLADKLGLDYLGRVGELPNYFSFAVGRADFEKRNLETSILFNHSEILYWDQQIPRKRLFKRDGTVMDSRPLKQALELKDPGFDEQWHLVVFINLVQCGGTRTRLECNGPLVTKNYRKRCLCGLY